MWEGYQDFKARIEHKYGIGFVCIRRCLELGNATFDTLNSQRLTQPVEVATSTIYARMFTTQCAILVLLEHGFGLDAGTLLRSLTDGFINLAYITTSDNPNELSRRWIQYQKVSHHKYLMLCKKLQIHVEPHIEQAVLARLEEFKDEFGDNSTKRHDWSGKDTFSKAQDAGVEDVYLRLYKPFSGVAHIGPEGWVRLVTETRTETIISTTPSFVGIVQVIPGASELFCRATIMLAKVFSLEGIEGQALGVLDECRAMYEKLPED